MIVHEETNEKRTKENNYCSIMYYSRRSTLGRVCCTGPSITLVLAYHTSRLEGTTTCEHPSTTTTETGTSSIRTILRYVHSRIKIQNFLHLSSISVKSKLRPFMTYLSVLLQTRFHALLIDKGNIGRSELLVNRAFG